MSNIESTSMTVKWTPPKSDGGAEITGYVVQQKEKLALRWTPVNAVTVMETSFKVTGLVQKNEYEFRVVAENKAGFGQPSDASDAVLAKPPYGEFVSSKNSKQNFYNIQNGDNAQFLLYSKNDLLQILFWSK